MENEVDLSINSPSPSPQGVGQLLRAAREEKGLSLGDISAYTRVAERHLQAIESNRFEDLAAPTYAVGFSRAYAKAVGLDQADIAARVRRQLDLRPPSRPAPPPSFEPGDPARVPPSKIAWLAGLCAVFVVGLLVVYWSNLFTPEGELPSLLPNGVQSEAPAVAAAPAQAPPSPTPTDGAVVLTSNGARVWVKVTDQQGNQLFQKELVQGESWTVPADAQSPQLRTGRPDQLQITVGGRAIARLGSKPEVVSGIMLTPAALIARGLETATAPAAAPSGVAQRARGPASAPVSARDQDSLAERAVEPVTQEIPLSTTAE